MTPEMHIRENQPWHIHQWQGTDPRKGPMEETPGVHLSGVLDHLVPYQYCIRYHDTASVWALRRLELPSEQDHRKPARLVQPLAISV